jgi:hypothetical protein
MMFPLKIGLIGAASLHSLEAVALAIVAARWANAILSNGYLRGELGYTYREMAAAVRKPLVILVASAVGPAAALPIAPHQPISALAIAATAAASGWMIATFAMHHPLSHEIRRLRARTTGLAKARWSKRFATAQPEPGHQE